MASGNMLAFIRDKKVPGSVYDKDRPIMTKETALALQDHEALHCRTAMLQQKIEAMRADGTLGRILTP